jgi:hypothetical protein
MLLATLALLVAAAFAGAAIYISLVEQPARMALADGDLLAEWKIAYRRGTAMQAPLALVGGALGVASFLMEDASPIALVGAGLMLANWPWTAVLMMPTNNTLSATPLEGAGAEVRRLLQRWGNLHLVRGVLGIAASICFALVRASA